MRRTPFQQRPSWRWWVTPGPLNEKPIHRWYVFPHSFTSDLVHALIDEWNLGPKDHILDPFVGAGTTILAAKEKGVSASGYDLSPLAVFAAKVKISHYETARLKQTWDRLRRTLNPSRWNGASKPYPDLVVKALPGRLLGAFDAVAREIDDLPCSPTERNFFRLALISILPNFSRAIATGGWLKWVEKHTNVQGIPSHFESQINEMMDDLKDTPSPQRGTWRVEKRDARCLPDHTSTYSAVISSPPYPNRHDYTRVFGVELMFGFLDWEGTRRLRYQSFHSHPEARPHRPPLNGYKVPTQLRRAISHIRKQTKEERIPLMLEGYFQDMYLSLREIRRVCKTDARIAFVVGNAQYYGKTVPVDEITASLGEQTGLKCKHLRVARYRGNSAQQMGKYGRNPSRESVVIFMRR